MSERTEQLLGTGEIAARFGLSVSTTKRFDRLGILPTARRVAGRRVWDEGQLPLIEECLKARRTGRRQESGKAA